MFKEKAILAMLFALLVFLVAGPVFAENIWEKVQNGKTKEVIEMIKKDPSLLTKTDTDNTNVFHCAAAVGDIELLKFCLKKGADLEALSVRGETPFLYAAALGHLEAAKLLADKGANVHIATSFGNCITFAAGRKNMDMVKYLISKGVDVHFKSEEGETILHRIAQRTSAEIAQFMIDKGIPADGTTKDGFTPLHWAVAGGNVEVAKLLINKGADVNKVPGKWDWAFPLFSATTNGHKELIPILLKAGANVDHVKKNTRQTALHLAVIKGYGKIAHMLLQGGADPNVKDILGNTPLYYAARYGHKKAAKVILTKGGNGVDLEKMEKNFGYSPILKKKFKNGDAVVWFLGHSGYAVKTAGHLLIFDYWKGNDLPDTPLLANGVITPEEIKDLSVTVFSSHSHRDHYMPAIFDWKKSVPNIHYIMGFKPDKIDEKLYTFIGPRKTQNINGMEIITIESNDSGVGFYVRVDGVEILHSGDHANRKRDFSGPFTKEIDFLASKGLQPDIFFAPVSGCGFGDQVAVRKGVYYTVKKLAPKTLFPMHGSSERLLDFVLQAKKAGLKKHVSCPLICGDWFFVSKGKVKKAHVENVNLLVKQLANLEAAENKKSCKSKKSCESGS